MTVDVTITQNVVTVTPTETGVDVTVAPEEVTATTAPGISTFLGLIDTPDAFTGQGGRVVAVNAGGTALEFSASAGSDKTYRHVQASASAAWTVTHNLGKRVSVDVVDSAGDQVFGQVHYDSDNQVTISFSSAFGGEAYCN